MSGSDLLVLLPLILAGYGAVVVMLVGAISRRHQVVAALTCTSLAAGFLALLAAAPLAPRQVTPLLHVDPFGLFYMALFLLGALLIALLSYDYLGRDQNEKYYALLLLAALGMMALVVSSHFVSFFLGLEILSVSLYGLIGYTLRRPASLEASMKYLVLAGAAQAFLLFGIALIYSEFGTMDFGVLALRLTSTGVEGPSSLALLGLAMIVVGFGFKFAAVPFHTWAPDVYQGAPAPVSALVATGSKAAMFAVLLRLVSAVLPPSAAGRGAFSGVLQTLAIITMFGGNLLALLQPNIKRLLAYSSVAHMGYLLIPLVAGGEDGISSISFYFASYFIATIGAFGVVSILSREGAELEDLADYRGLGLRRPLLGAALGLTMLSLAGIPLTVGFMAKLYIFAAAARAGLWPLLAIGLLNSGLAAYYYLRVLAALYLRVAPAAPLAPGGRQEGAAQPRPGREGARWPQARVGSAIVVATLVILLLLFGIYPGPLVSLAQQASALWLSGL